MNDKGELHREMTRTWCTTQWSSRRMCGGLFWSRSLTQQNPSDRWTHAHAHTHTHTHRHTHMHTRTTLTLPLCCPQVILQHFYLKQHEVLRQCREWRRVFAEAAEKKKHLTTVSAKLRILDSLLPQLERKLTELKPDQLQTNTSGT